MKYMILIGLLLGVTMTLTAGEDSLKTMTLNGVVIQGNRISIPFRESSRNITIISGPEIRSMPVISIPEILTYVPGVDIRQRGPLGIQADIGIRGGTFEQTLILVNGLKLTDPQTGHHNLNVPLSFSNLERVEVLKGPGARIFGQNAFSGAVNFITRVPDRRYAGLRLYGGQHQLLGGGLELSIPTGKYRQFVSYSYDGSEGYRYNTDFRINNIFYQANADLSGGTLEVIGGWTGRKFGANGFYANPSYTEQYEEISTSMLSLGYVKRIGGFTIRPRIYWRKNNDHYFLFRNNPESYQNDHTTQVGAAEVNTEWENSLGQTGIGMEYRREGITGTWIRNGTQSPSNLDGYTRNNLGIFFEHRFRYGKWDLTPGIFVSYYSDFGWSAFPGFDIGYLISPALRLYANLGRSYRVPNFYEMYYESPVEAGNPDLDPEKALTVETGARYLKGAMSLELNWFYQNAFDLIDWEGIPVSDSTYFWKAANLSSIKRNGIEIGAQLNMERLVDTDRRITDVFLSYNFIHSDLDRSAALSRYALENLRHQLIMGLTTRIVSRIFLDIRARMNQRENETAFWVIDSRLYWEKAGWPYIFLESTNLTNTPYQEVMTPMPGRWFRAGIMYQLGF